MHVSQYNISFPIRESEKFILTNALSGAVDIVEKEVLNALEEISFGKDLDQKIYGPLIGKLQERGYLFAIREEEDEIIQKMKRKLDADMATAPENFILSVTYNCNMHCQYCFQSDVLMESSITITEEMLNSAFEFMRETHERRGAKSRPLVTIYGGEPLLPGDRNRERIESILERISNHKWGVVIISNGITLKEYCNSLKKYRDVIKEIHVTLDGQREVHNRRRPMVGGKGSFDQIVEGIDVALDNAFPINLRFVADNGNIDSLPSLVDFMYEKGWTDLPHFTPHMGRICCGCPGEYTHNVIPTDVLIKKLLRFYKDSDRIANVIPTRCMGLDQLSKTGRPYPPIFAACPGGKIEYAMDSKGDLYPCSAAMGKEEFRIGRYFPHYEIAQDRYQKWQKRNILNDSKCSQCEVALYCGGGCPIEAFIEKGDLTASSCRPVLSTLSEGFNYFFPKLQAMAGSTVAKKTSCC